MHIVYPGELNEMLVTHLPQVSKGESTDRRHDFYKGVNSNILGLRTDAHPGFSVYGANGFASPTKFLRLMEIPPGPFVKERTLISPTRTPISRTHGHSPNRRVSRRLLNTLPLQRWSSISRELTIMEQFS